MTTPHDTPSPPEAPGASRRVPQPVGDDGDEVVRRAPFSANSKVGARGQRTQQRIFDAALEVFGDLGYHRCSVEKITTLAGCSRVSFYQYFSSKEDLFRQMAGQVARQLSASMEALGPVTGDGAGWAELRAWVGRHAEIYERHEPVFNAFHAAVETDEAVAGGSVRTSRRNVERFRSRIEGVHIPQRRLDPMVNLLMETVTRTSRNASALRRGVEESYPPDAVADVVADVLHRSLFGRIPGINERGSAAPPPPSAGTTRLRDDLGHDAEVEGSLTPAGRRTRDALLVAGRSAFVERGYHATRVDDIVEAAGVSHGAFYRYFASKEEIAHLVAVRAIGSVAGTFAAMPSVAVMDDATCRSALRGWLESYNRAHAAEAAVIQVWIDAEVEGTSRHPDSAPALDWARRRMARVLRHRDFGDAELEAVVMLSLVVAFGCQPRSRAEIDAAAQIATTGLLGRAEQAPQRL